MYPASGGVQEETPANAVQILKKIRKIVSY